MGRYRLSLEALSNDSEFRWRGQSGVKAQTFRSSHQQVPADTEASADEQRVLDQLHAADALEALSLPGLRLEKLKGDRAGPHSVRINDQHRVCLVWTDAGPENVEIVDSH